MSKFNIFTIDLRVILWIIVATGVYALLLEFLQKNSPHNVQMNGGGGKGFANNFQKTALFLRDGFLYKLCFLGMTMYHFLSAMVDGPGYLPLGWKPKEVLKLCQIFYYLNKNMYCICNKITFQGNPEEWDKLLQWCAECAGYKAPRAHHCRKCGRLEV